MKRTLAILTLAVAAVTAQSITVVPLNPVDSDFLRQAERDVAVAQQHLDGVRDMIRLIYAGGEDFKCGYVVSKDYKYIVPSPLECVRWSTTKNLQEK
jgi:hypothetical protein